MSNEIDENKFTTVLQVCVKGRYNYHSDSCLFMNTREKVMNSLMKKIPISIAIISVILSASANASYIFSCTSTSGDKINLYKSNERLIVSINDKKIVSQDSVHDIFKDIDSRISVNNDYIEFRANEYYIAIGNINTQEESNGSNEKEILRVGVLSKDRSGESSNTIYNCSSDYKNNIPDFVLD
ncbi:TPA: hypothetical protein ACIPUI_000062 [Citrobacter freundii]